MTKPKLCDCELCLFKQNSTNNNVLNDKNKILESIIYHFIFRIGLLTTARPF